LKNLYYKPESEEAFTGAERLFKKAKEKFPSLKKADVHKWLQQEETYGVHFPYRGKFARSRIVVGGIDYMWEIDLMDMSKLSKRNKGFTFVLLVIDAFSRFVWTVPLKNKSADESLRALKKIFSESGRHPKYIRHDQGTEFTNRKVQRHLQSLGIKDITTSDDVKASLAERAIRSVKGRLFRYMYHKQTYVYIDVLPHITAAYNNSYHRILRLSPSQVSLKNERQIWNQMYNSVKFPYVLKKTQNKNLLPVGSYVRISFYRHVFSREYRQKWSSELFQIYKRQMRDGIVVYFLRDLSGEDLRGSFYREELQPATYSPDTVYKIEKILRYKRNKAGKKLMYVKWLNWGPKFNSWISEDDVSQLT
jgi:transposase InsO family protein